MSSDLDVAQEEGRGEISGGDFMWHSAEQEHEVCAHSSRHAPLCRPDRLAAGFLMGPSVEWSQKRELALLPLTRAFSPSPAASAREDKGPNTWSVSALCEVLSLPQECESYLDCFRWLGKV